MAYYRIKEAAEKIGVLPHVLRFWESQFPGLKAPKTSRGQRLYTDEIIENFRKVKHLLYNEGFSIPGAKKYLKEEKKKPRESGTLGQVELEKAFAKDLLVEIEAIQGELREV